jgi:DNA modification methylase
LPKPKRSDAGQAAKVTTVEIEDLTPDPANVRMHPEANARATDASLLRFGAARSIVVDGSNVVRAGNRTLESARAAGIRKVLIVEPGPDQLVAVRRPEWTPLEATAYAIADNRTTDLSEFDEAKLAETLEALRSGPDLDLGSVGYGEAALGELLDRLAREALASDQPPAPEAKVDRAAELLRDWKVEPGDLWAIPSRSDPRGEHRLLCGDSTKPEDVARVMGGDQALLMNTDPPYGISNEEAIAARNDAKNATAGTNTEFRSWDAIQNDDLTGERLQAFLESAIRVAVPHLVDHAAFYLWHPMLTQGTFFAAVAAADILIHRQIIWVKPHFIFGRGDYHWRHELCFYGWRRGYRPAFYGERNQDTVWTLDEGGGSIRKDQGHPTQKPVELFTRPILNHTRRGEAVYEPFAGSGSQYIAAEQTGRLCRGLELTPKYVAVTLQRLADMGLSPRRVGA